MMYNNYKKPSMKHLYTTVFILLGFFIFFVTVITYSHKVPAVYAATTGLTSATISSPTVQRGAAVQLSVQPSNDTNQVDVWAWPGDDYGARFFVLSLSAANNWTATWNTSHGLTPRVYTVRFFPLVVQNGQVIARGNDQDKTLTVTYRTGLTGASVSPASMTAGASPAVTLTAQAQHDTNQIDVHISPAVGGNTYIGGLTAANNWRATWGYINLNSLPQGTYTLTFFPLVVQNGQIIARGNDGTATFTVNPPAATPTQTPPAAGLRITNMGFAPTSPKSNQEVDIGITVNDSNSTSTVDVHQYPNDDFSGQARFIGSISKNTSVAGSSWHLAWAPTGPHAGFRSAGCRRMRFVPINAGQSDWGNHTDSRICFEQSTGLTSASAAPAEVAKGSTSVITFTAEPQFDTNQVDVWIFPEGRYDPESNRTYLGSLTAANNWSLTWNGAGAKDLGKYTVRFFALRVVSGQITARGGDLDRTIEVKNDVSGTCPKKVQGDTDCNGSVTIDDFTLWRREFLGEVTTKLADFNNDGKVDLIDFETWRQNKT
jgi:hypothetical protein